jgi:hypothetical protein
MEDIGMEDDWEVAQRIFILSGVPKGMGVSTENGKERFGVTLAGFRVARSFQENGVLMALKRFVPGFERPAARQPRKLPQLQTSRMIQQFRV